MSWPRSESCCVSQSQPIGLSRRASADDRRRGCQLNDTPMLSIPEVSLRLRVKPEKVRGWVVRGELIGVRR
jgi:hypothetical protein